MQRIAGLLILVLTLAGFAQAVAQGRMAGARGVELCTEAGVAEVLVDAEGNPVAALHDCADCVMPVMAAAPEAAGLALPEGRARPQPWAQADRRNPPVLPVPAARGPPVRPA